MPSFQPCQSFYSRLSSTPLSFNVPPAYYDSSSFSNPTTPTSYGCGTASTDASCPTSILASFAMGNGDSSRRCNESSSSSQQQHPSPCSCAPKQKSSDAPTKSHYYQNNVPPAFINNGPSCNQSQRSPAERLRNVDVLEELCYYAPDGQNDSEQQCYSVCTCCGASEFVGCECPEKNHPNPVKYSRRQRFSFEDNNLKMNDFCNGPKWPFNPPSHCKHHNRHKKQCGKSSCCNTKDDLPHCTGVYYYSASKRMFIPQEDLPKPPEVIQIDHHVKSHRPSKSDKRKSKDCGPVVQEFEIFEEDDSKQDKEPEVVTKTLIQPIILPAANDLARSNHNNNNHGNGNHGNGNHENHWNQNSVPYNNFNQNNPYNNNNGNNYSGGGNNQNDNGSERSSNSNDNTNNNNNNQYQNSSNGFNPYNNYMPYNNNCCMPSMNNPFMSSPMINPFANMFQNMMNPCNNSNNIVPMCIPMINQATPQPQPQPPVQSQSPTMFPAGLSPMIFSKLFSSKKSKKKKKSKRAEKKRNYREDDCSASYCPPQSGYSEQTNASEDHYHSLSSGGRQPEDEDEEQYSKNILVAGDGSRKTEQFSTNILVAGDASRTTDQFSKNILVAGDASHKPYQFSKNILVAGDVNKNDQFSTNILVPGVNNPSQYSTNILVPAGTNPKDKIPQYSTNILAPAIASQSTAK